MANPDLSPDDLRRLQKPKKGSAKLARLDKARARKREEDRNKRAAKQRDGSRCQRPHCPNCKEYGRSLGPVQGAHWKAKGMGGDKQNLRSQRKHFISLDPVTHGEFERHELEIVPLDDRLLMDGSREFYRIEGRHRILEGVSHP